MQKREFVELAAPRFRAGLLGMRGTDQFKNETAVLIALDLWAEIEKQCPRVAGWPLEVPT